MSNHLTLILWMGFCTAAIAQTGSDTGYTDSLQQQIDQRDRQIENFQSQLARTKLKRKQDSLARIDLLKQIQILQESGEVDKNNLREQLRQISKMDSARNADIHAKIEKLRARNTGITVAPFQDSLFSIYLKIGSTLPAERASQAQNRIETLVNQDFFFSDSLYISADEGTVDINYQQMILISLSEWDALLAGTEVMELAHTYRGIILTYVQDRRNSSQQRNFLVRIGLVLLTILVMVVVLYVVRRLIVGAKGWLYTNRKKYITGLKAGSYEFLPPGRQLDVIMKALSGFKWVLYMLVFYLSLPVIFGLFPFTKGWAETLLSWILNPAKGIWISFWTYLPNIFTIAVICLITRYAIRFLKFISSEIEQGRLTISGFHADWALPTFKIVRLLVYAFMFVVIFPYLPGSDSDIFKGVSVFLGILFSLGSSSAIANAVAGLVITYMRPFRLGDRVKIGEITGEVIEKSLLVTRIRTTKNEDITVPNSSILTGHTVNYSSSSQELGLVLHTSVTIGYDVPWRQVHELLMGAALATNGVEKNRKPFVLQTSLDDWYVSYQLNAYTTSPEQMPKIYSELHSHIQDQFNAAGVEIMSPHYRAVRDGNESTLPKQT